MALRYRGTAGQVVGCWGQAPRMQQAERLNIEWADTFAAAERAEEPLPAALGVLRPEADGGPALWLGWRRTGDAAGCVASSCFSDATVSTTCGDVQTPSMSDCRCVVMGLPKRLRLAEESVEARAAQDGSRCLDACLLSG